jgi:hypothetical protein
VSIEGQEQHPVAGRFLEIRRSWKNGDQVQIHLALPARAQAWGPGTIVTRGPLLFALPVAATEKRKGTERWSDEELYPAEAWNWAPLLKPGAEIPASQIEVRPLAQHAFDPSQAPLTLKVPGRAVANWERQDNSAGPLPPLAQLAGAERNLELVPYASTRLRVTVFPRVP